MEDCQENQVFRFTRSVAASHSLQVQDDEEAEEEGDNDDVDRWSTTKVYGCFPQHGDP